MKIVMLSATIWEIRLLIKSLGLLQTDANTYEGGIGKSSITVMLTGMGFDRARRGAVRASSVGPDLVVATGFAGSIREDILPGDLVIDRARSSPQFAEIAEDSAERIHLRHHQGAFYCSEKIIARSSEKKSLGIRTGAIAVEMESQPMFEVLSSKKIPVLFARVISDGMDQNLPDMDAIFGVEGDLKLFSLIKLMCRPGDWSDFFRLALGSRKAGKNLAAVLKEISTHA